MSVGTVRYTNQPTIAEHGASIRCYVCNHFAGRSQGSLKSVVAKKGMHVLTRKDVSEDRGQIERLKWFEALQTVSKSEM
jgi:hypothetical protein